MRKRNVGLSLSVETSFHLIKVYIIAYKDLVYIISFEHKIRILNPSLIHV